MKKFEFECDEKVDSNTTVEVYPNVTELTDEAYYKIWSLSFEAWQKRYPNIKINEKEFDECYQALGRDYATAMESMVSASR